SSSLYRRSTSSSFCNMGDQPRKKRAREATSLALFTCCVRSTGAAGALLLHAVFTLESFDATRRIDQLLLSRKERVATRADFHMNRRHRRPRLDDISAGADDLGRLIFRMYTLFHLPFYPQ